MPLCTAHDAGDRGCAEEQGRHVQRAWQSIQAGPSHATVLGGVPVSHMLCHSLTLGMAISQPSSSVLPYDN